jgi:hypothetical protein
MDSRLPFFEPAQSHSHQIPQDLCWLVLCDFGAADILFYPTQSPPSSWWYACHGKINRVLANLFPAYTIYSFFEWALVLLDVAFDAVTISEFQDFEIVVKDNRGISRGYVSRLPS